MATGKIEWHEVPSKKADTTMIAERNDAINSLKKSAPSVREMVMNDQDVQAGLDALDPFSPTFIRERGVRKLVVQGIRMRLEIAASID